MKITDKYILFYGKDWPSNFAESPITVRDDFMERGIWNDEQPTITFKTAEAYYQSRKAVLMGDKYNYYKIALAPTPSDTKKISRDINLDQKAWDRVRVKMMWDTLHLKFDQNPDLREKLLDPSLDGKKFVEASPSDCFWGAGRNEIGLLEEIRSYGDIQWWDYKRDVPTANNMLGELLTKIRAEFKNSI